MYVAVKRKVSSTSFNGPDVNKILTKKDVFFLIRKSLISRLLFEKG